MKKLGLFSLFLIVLLSAVRPPHGSAARPRPARSASESIPAAALIVGVPDEDAGTIADAGVIDLLYGIRDVGLTTATAEYYGQSASAGVGETYDHYGYALASGDFNADGYFDIAVGVPYESDDTYSHVGAVNVLYGGAGGFTRQAFWPADALTGLALADDDHFGWALAAGDFDGDGYDDLAVGAPDYDCCGDADSGLVVVLYGSRGGLEKVSATFDTLSGTNDVGGHYGWALASADFDGDGYDDLAIGAPGEVANGTSATGGNITVMYGTTRDAATVAGVTFSQSGTGQGVSEDGDLFGYSLATGDFDTDGYPDLAIGAPGEDIGSVADAGAVNILYSGGLMFDTSKSQVWYQDLILDGNGDPQNDSQAGDQFGFSLAAGDFDHDGHADLAIGIPFQDSLTPDAGMVQVLFGTTASGLDDAKSAIFDSNIGSEELGYALAAGDFDGDRRDDLAIGKPTASSTVSEDGEVIIHYGDDTTANGFSATRTVTYSQNDLPPTAAEEGDHFGRALAVLPPPHVTRADALLVGVPDEDVGSVADAGVLGLIHGESGVGLDNTGLELFSQTGSDGTVEADDHYGYAIASGDFDGNGYFDIAVGVPYESNDTYSHAGAVNILYGSADGFTRQYLFASDITEWIIGDDDHFGWALAVGDFDGDGYDDLAVGAPGFDTYGAQGADEAGMVAVLYGSRSGLVRTDAAFKYLTGQDDVGGHFGWALASADFDRDGYDDLAVGAPGELVNGTTVSGGNVAVMYGVAKDASGISYRLFSQSDTGTGTSADGDLFGYSLATGDFNHDHYPDLAIGVPGREIGSATDAGAVVVVYDIDSLDAQLWYQDIILALESSTPQDDSETGDQFGTTLAVGDFDDAEADDLAIGIPFEDHSGLEQDSGMVQVLFGFGEIGLDDEKNAKFAAQYGHQELGYALAAGDFDGDGCDDLAMGLPIAPGGATADGEVLVFYGDTTSPEGFHLTRYDLYDQDNLPSVAPEDNDHFGAALAVLPAPLHRLYLPLTVRNH